ncbi:MAG: efflux RND transporter permease subunit [Gammaproteobacteria bacterium]|nr:efflux RND transporter permease subunit [Gammaproteobacteria bacterium]MDH5801848.1 efflux RND transporter permease subunit [Gammaproteobacteria bacterium]
MNKPLGVSGAIAGKFLQSEITPLLALVGFLLGVFAVLITPREEEPQINVTFANVFIAFPGASSTEVEQLVSTPAEQILSEIDGIKHVYSVSQPGQSVLTVQFEVGEDRTQAIVRLYNAIYSNQDWLPPGLGVAQPVIKPMGIDDVPIVTLTLWSEASSKGGYDLQQVAHAIEAELKRVPGTRDIYTIGGVERVVHVQPDISRLAAYGVTFQDLKTALQLSNQSQSAGDLVSDNRTIEVRAGQFLSTVDEVASLVIAVHKDAPVYLRDVAQITLGPDQPEQYVWFGTGPAAADKSIQARGEFPAVTIAVAKKQGTNAVGIANQIIERFEQLKGVFVPADVNVTVTRNYGATADEKARKLIGKLVFATAFVVLLVFFTLGWKEAFIVGVAVIITLAITLFASWAWGFTINRVSLFALIFSIGILVDDAIVVVENIHRHLQDGDKSLVQAIPLAVDEVGGPTILATFAVIAALLPMAFVTGLMGPYMSPIPINASLGMLISLAVAFIVTPWMARLVLAGKAHAASHGDADDRLYTLFNRHMGPFLNGAAGASKRWMMFGVVMFLILISVLLPVFKLVVLKMLPFDNKSEFQIVLDLPNGSSVEQTAAVLREMAAYVATVEEVSDYQVYAGAASPINFNGLVRQYYLRRGTHVGDIQVNLQDKSRRDRSSHEVAMTMRPAIVAIAKRHNADVKVVEVPPGPPVMAPIVAEIYGLDYEQQRHLAKQLRATFESTKDISDVDDSVESPAAKLLLHVDRSKAAAMGVSQAAVVQEISMALGGADVSYLHGDHVKFPTPIRLEAGVGDKAYLESLTSLKVRNNRGQLVAVSDVVSVSRSDREKAIYHKDLLPVVFVTGDLAGGLDSPLYGMFDIVSQLDLEQYFINTPDNPYRFSIKWDGEWQVTYETFRDMGIAYAVGIILIYLLVVAQFRSYFIPLIIMAPIPLTVIGVMPGHALLGSQFTATSMIGMIALAGIIVRNSILLVDFIREQHQQGMSFDEAVIRSGAVRAKPIILTGLAAMLGALFILDDPIFNGLAISLIFGVFVSTLLTLIVIPVMFYAFYYRRGLD